MKPEIKAQWVAALRSGDYKQGQAALNDGRGGFCCLGVLCDLHAKATGGKWQHPKDSDAGSRGGGDNLVYDTEQMFLPQVVQDWAGLTEGYGLAVRNHTAVDLTLPILNDGNSSLDVRPCSFHQIAQIIEDNA